MPLSIVDDGAKISSIVRFIFSFESLDDKIVILSTKFLNSLTLPGQLYVYKLSLLISMFDCCTPLISESLLLKYSINKGLWGTSIGGKETLGSRHNIPENAYPSKVDKKKEENISLTFKKGEIVAVNNIKASPIENIKKIEKIASKFGIGRDTHVGDTIIGIKGRVGFEAAAPILIIKAHHLLEKHTLTKWQLIYKEQLCINYGLLLHEGQYLDPVMRDIEKFLISSQKNVSGDVFIKLNPYRYELIGIKSKFDLMDSKFGNYGEMNKQWSADEVKGFIKILSNQNKIYQKINKND